MTSQQIIAPGGIATNASYWSMVSMVNSVSFSSYPPMYNEGLVLDLFMGAQSRGGIE